ncbi:MAG: hypothetical protein ACO38A_05340, partial [Ilumatobacteraceae bacterium]
MSSPSEATAAPLFRVTGLRARPTAEPGAPEAAEILRGLAKAHNLAHDFSTARDYIARSIALFEQARGKPFLGVAFRTLGE